MTNLNQYIYTSEFFKLYPEISLTTFWRWCNTGKRLHIKKGKKYIWTEPYILPLAKRDGKHTAVLISLKALHKFFNQIGEEEYALRVPSYSRSGK